MIVMTGAHGRDRGTLAAMLVLSGMLLASPPALALNPDFDVSQYPHAPWKVRDGFVNGAAVPTLYGVLSASMESPVAAMQSVEGSIRAVLA